MKWLKSPGITANDCEMIDASMRTLALLSLNEELAWKLVDENDVFSFLEVGSECWQQCFLLLAMYFYCKYFCVCVSFS